MNDFQNEALYNFSQKLNYCDVLIDAFADEEWAHQISDVSADEIPQRQLSHSLFTEGSAKTPWLLRVPHKRFDVLQRLAARAYIEAINPYCQIRSVCGFIRSGLSLEDLAQELEQRLSIRVGNKNIYFRYFDPRVMHHAPCLIPPEKKWLDGVLDWGYFTWEGQFANHTSSDQTLPMRFSHPLYLTNQQWQPFYFLTHFNETISAFLRAEVGYSASKTESLRKTIQSVISLGFNRPRDVAYYIVRSHQYGVPINKHPSWIEIKKIVDEGVPLSAAFSAYC